MLSGFYKKDLIMINGKISENSNYNLFVNSVLNSYTSVTLHSDLAPAMGYLLIFKKIIKSTMILLK
jgi:hypothetical protein